MGEEDISDAPGGMSSPYAIRTDKRRLERIVVNLVENALLHGRAPVGIELRRVGVAADGRTPPSADLVRIAVTDSGPGIPKSTCPMCSIVSTKPTRVVRAVVEAGWAWR